MACCPAADVPKCSPRQEDATKYIGSLHAPSLRAVLHSVHLPHLELEELHEARQLACDHFLGQPGHTPFIIAATCSSALASLHMHTQWFSVWAPMLSSVLCSEAQAFDRGQQHGAGSMRCPLRIPVACQRAVSKPSLQQLAQGAWGGSSSVCRQIQGSQAALLCVCTRCPHGPACWACADLGGFGFLQRRQLPGRELLLHLGLCLKLDLPPLERGEPIVCWGSASWEGLLLLGCCRWRGSTALFF